MRFKRSVRTALVTAAALVAGACGPAPSNPEALPWSQFTLGAGVTQGNAHATAGATSADGSVQAGRITGQGQWRDGVAELGDRVVRSQVAAGIAKVRVGMALTVGRQD